MRTGNFGDRIREKIGRTGSETGKYRGICGITPRLVRGLHQSIETSENEPIDVAEDKALRRLTPKHIDLMAKNQNFGLQRRAGSEQPGHKGTKPT